MKTLSNIKQINIEALLKSDKSNAEKALILDKAINQLIFTDVGKAAKYLDAQAQIIKDLDLPDIKFNYHLNAAFFENQMYHYKEAEWHYKKSFEMLMEWGNINQQVETFIDYIGTCINLKKFQLARDIAEKAAVQLKSFPDKKLSARLLCRRGFMELHHFDFSKAHEFFLQALNEFEQPEEAYSLKDYYFLTLSYNGLGTVYQRLNKLKQSVTAYEKVVDISKSIGMKTRLAWHYLNAGNALMNMDKQDEAISFFEMAINSKDDLSKKARAAAYANLGSIFFGKDEFDKALALFDKAEDIYNENEKDNYVNLSVIENWRAKLFAKRNQDREALAHFIKANDFANKSHDYRQLSIVYKDIAAFYAGIDDFKSAYEYQLEFEKAAEKHTEKLNAKRMEEFEIRFEAEKRTQEAKMAKLEAKKLQHKALRAQMNPHFIFNSLNSIENFITSHQPNEASAYLAKFSNLIRKSFEYSGMDFISLENEIEFLRQYLSINKDLRFNNKLDFSITMSDDIEPDIMGVPTMIVQPYVENSIEHGIRAKEKGSINIHFSLADDNTILCTVIDDGIGRAAAKALRAKSKKYRNHRSRGTAITEERLALLTKSDDDRQFVRFIDIVDEERKALGTRVEILIPFTDMVR